MNKTLVFDVKKTVVIDEDPRFLVCKFYFGLIGENYNGSIIYEDDYENNIGTIGYTPICGYFIGKDFDEHHPKQRPLGSILSFADCQYGYEKIDDSLYACAVGIIAKKYLPTEEVENILESQIKKISIELEILESERLSDGKQHFKKWIYQCITILGDKYQQGMKGAHLEVINSPRDEYSSFAKNTIESFLLKDDKNKFIESEGDLMEFNKEEFAKSMELSAAEVLGKIEDIVGEEKYKDVDGWQWSRYWVEDYDKEYVYVVDIADGYKLKAVPYTVTNKKFELNWDDVKLARQRPFIDEEGANFSAMFAEIKKRCESVVKAEFTTKLEDKQNIIVTMGQKIDSLKDTFTIKETKLKEVMSEKKQLEEKLNKFIKEKLRDDADSILLKYSSKISEEEKQSFIEKLDEVVDIKEFEKEVKAFVCDKYEKELKGKVGNEAFSHLGIVKPTDLNSKNSFTWHDYYNEYQKNN